MLLWVGQASSWSTSSRSADSSLFTILLQVQAALYSVSDPGLNVVDRIDILKCIEAFE